MADIHNDRDLALQAINPRLRIVTNSTIKPYIVSGWWYKKPTANQILIKHVFPMSVAFPLDLEGSFLTCITLPTATTVFNIKKDTTTIATATFYTASNHNYNYYLSSAYLSSSYSGSNNAFFDTFDTVPTFETTQNITLEAPAVPDSTLAGLTLSLRGGR